MEQTLNVCSLEAGAESHTSRTRKERKKKTENKGGGVKEKVEVRGKEGREEMGSRRTSWIFVSYGKFLLCSEY